MVDVTVVYCRDSPALVVVGKGRRGAKKQLPERFEQAIDAAAMRLGANDAYAYLSVWRNAPPYLVEGFAADVAYALATRLET